MRNLILLLLIFCFSCTNQIDDNLEENNNEVYLQKKGCLNNCFSSDITDNYLGFDVYTYPENASGPWINDHAFVSWDYSNSNTILTDSTNNCNIQVLLEFKSVAGVTSWDYSANSTWFSQYDDYFTVDITSEFLANSQGATTIIVGDYTNSSAGIYDVRIFVNAQCGLLLGCCQTSEWISICACLIP